MGRPEQKIKHAREKAINTLRVMITKVRVIMHFKKLKKTVRRNRGTNLTELEFGRANDLLKTADKLVEENLQLVGEGNDLMATANDLVEDNYRLAKEANRLVEECNAKVDSIK